MCTHHLPQLVPNRVVATWEGYRSERFVLEGRDCILVQPDIPMRSSPWIWRTEFFGAFPALDLALLKAGFRVAYIDVQNMYGAPIAMRYMDRFYARMVETFGLLPKCVLEGFSRGALYALNWAALNPRSVACLYLDAPVCDFKSWPAGRGRAQGSAFFFQAEDGIRGVAVTGVQTCALPISPCAGSRRRAAGPPRPHPRGPW